MIRERVSQEKLPTLLKFFPNATYTSVGTEWAFNLDENRYMDMEFYNVTYAEGCVITDGERNGYDDSDFYLLILHQNDAGLDIVGKFFYASTRYGGQGIYGTMIEYSIDATDETLERRRLAEERIVQEMKDAGVADMISKGAPADVARLFVDKLGRYNDQARYWDVRQLLCVKKFRSEFRKSMREQVELWLRDPNPTYVWPLSPRQTTAIADLRRRHTPEGF